jgi:hypothetical protein
MNGARPEPAEAILEEIEGKGSAVQTLRIVPLSLAELADEWAEQLARRVEASVAVARFWDVRPDEAEARELLEDSQKALGAGAAARTAVRGGVSPVTGPQR